jgi:hypothetical protein
MPNERNTPTLRVLTPPEPSCPMLEAAIFDLGLTRESVSKFEDRLARIEAAQIRGIDLLCELKQSVDALVLQKGHQ